MRMNNEQVPKSCNANADPASPFNAGKAAIAQEESEASTARVREFAGALVTACLRKESCGNTGSPYPRRQPQATPTMRVNYRPCKVGG